MSEGKRSRLRLGGPTLQGIGESVSAAAEQTSELNADLIDLDRIEPDPGNPRGLGITAEEVAWLLDQGQITRARASEDLEPRVGLLLELHELSDSIRANGVLQPIKVYRHGTGFRIAYGERRYWGARIAQLASIPALILGARPARLRVLQLVENVQRSDLDLAARIRNVIGVLHELGEDGEATAPRLASTVGMSDRMARRYVQVANGPEDLLKAVLGSGTVKDLKVAAALAGMDAPQRAFMLGRLADGRTYAEALADWSSHQKALEPKASLLGRPRTKVTLGSTKNVALVRAIMQRLSEDGTLPDIAWDDYRAVAKAWQGLLAQIERSL
jgi:ParB family chromosome partitioning protein